MDMLRRMDYRSLMRPVRYYLLAGYGEPIESISLLGA